MKRLGIYLGFPPEGGGAFQYAHSVLVAASELAQDGIEVVAAHAHPAWKPRIEAFAGRIEALPVPKGAGETLVPLLLRLGFPASAWRRLAPALHPLVRNLRRAHCDAWMFPAQDYLAYAMPGTTIGVIHDLMHRHERRFPEVSSFGLHRRRERHYANLCAHARAVLVDSRLGRQHVVDAYRADPAKVHVLPFIAPPYMHTIRDPDDFDRRFQLPSQYLFYPAQFWQHKNHAGLFDALARIRAQRPELHLVLAGSTKNVDVAALAAASGLSDRVHVLGYVPDEYIPGLYRRAQALVMPTFFGPTNIPPLEAMAAGCPAAVSDIYAMREQLGDAALYFDPAEPASIASAILRISGDATLRAELVERGHALTRERSQSGFNDTFRTIIARVGTTP